MTPERRRLVRKLALESVVIVASILLAFSVDAAWDRHREAERAAAYLDALEEEFAAARDEMVLQLEEQGRQLEAIHHLLDVVHGTGGPAEGPAFWEAMGQLRPVYVYRPSHPVFEDLASAGTIDLLDSPELRIALLRYGQAKDFLDVLSDRELGLWQDRMAPYLVERTDGLRYMSPLGARDRTPRFPSGAEALTQDRDFQNLLLLRAGSVTSQRALDQEVLEAAEAVLEEIDRWRNGSR